MAAISITTADLVTAAINAATWADVTGGKVNAVRSYAEWSETLEDYGILHVDIVPVFNPATELETRAAVVYTQAIDIGIRKRLAQEDSGSGRVGVGEVDDLVSLTEAVHDFFVTDRFSNTEIIWKSSEIRALFNREQLRDNRQFLGLVRLTFEATKAL